MNTTRFTFCILLAAIIGVTGCAALKLVTTAWSTSKPSPDPLAGWQHASKNPEQIIINDYQDYMQKLSPEERKYLGPSPVSYFEDGTGQHAAVITIGLNETVWRHVLIYDKHNKRIKTIKYASGDYHS